MSARADSVLTGEVKWFNENKGYGFIIRDDGQPDLFVHHSDVDMRGFRALHEGERVEFQIGRGKKGAKAVRVRVMVDAAQACNQQQHESSPQPKL